MEIIYRNNIRLKICNDFEKDNNSDYNYCIKQHNYDLKIGNNNKDENGIVVDEKLKESNLLMEKCYKKALNSF